MDHILPFRIVLNTVYVLKAVRGILPGMEVIVRSLPTGSIVLKLALEHIKKGEDSMPTYDYHCEKCGRQFTLSQSIAEHDKKQTICPECGSDKVTQLISPFIAKTARKS